MRVALVSYEYPLDTPIGGISTYTYQAAHLLLSRGHNVEVFAGSRRRSCDVESEGIVVHLVRESSRYDFAIRIAYCLEACHLRDPFDVVEAPELYAESRKILELIPDIPLVIKMHTPNLTLWKLSVSSRRKREILFDLFQQIRNLPWYAAKRHRIPEIRLVRPDISYAQQFDMIENSCALSADRVVALFPGMRDFLTDVWRVPTQRVAVIPNPFVPSQDLLQIPTGIYPTTISFIGRLEVRKGILNWMNAIPAIAKQYPTAEFRFVGATSQLADGTNTQDVLNRHLKEFAGRIEFTGAVHPSQIPQELARTGIVVIPSLWENYPYSCLEAMAAGRAVVGSSAGGMAVMLADGAGILLKPGQPARLAKAVCKLLGDPLLQKRLGEKARAKVLADHQPALIGEYMEHVYQEAIIHRQTIGPRQP